MGYTPRSYKMFLASSIAVAVAASAVSPLSVEAATSTVQDVTFKDVKPSDYNFTAIEYLAEKGIIKGYENNIFKPNSTVTRAQAAKMIALALGLNVDTPQNPNFKDVTSNDWFYPYVAALKDANIISGYGDNYNPYQTLSRAQMTKILVLGFGLEEETLINNPFQDVKKDDWYTSYLSPLIDAKITTGRTPTTFDPNGHVTRGQLAAFIYRTLDFNQALENKLEGQIEAVQDKTLKINGQSYDVAESLHYIIKPTNILALENAKIQATIVNGVITKIQAIELTSNGTSDGIIQFDGQKQVFDGDVTVNGDSIKLVNIQITGNLSLGEKVQTQFSAENVTVQGKTIITDNFNDEIKEQETGSFYKSLFFKSQAPFSAQSEKGTVDYTFKDSSLNEVELQKMNSLVKLTGDSTVKAIKVNSNQATISSDSKALIEKVEVGSQVENLNLEGQAEELLVQSKKDFQLTGKVDIKKLVVDTTSKVDLQVSGSIETLESKDNDSVVSLGDKTEVKTVNVPAGSKASDFIENYNEVKGNIGNKTSSSGGGSGSSSSGSSGNGGVDTGNNQDDSSSEGNDSGEIPSENDSEIPSDNSGDEFSENPFVDNQVYTSDYSLISPDGAVYGANTIGNDAVVKGKVTVQGDVSKVTLQNLKIEGKLTLDPGEQAEIFLTNIEAEEIEIKSGKVGTVIFDNVNVEQDVTVTDKDGISLKSVGNNSIPNIQLSPGTEENGQAPEIQLKGNFIDSDIKILKQAKVAASDDFTAKQVTVHTPENDEVTLAGDFSSVDKVVVATSTSITSDAEAVIPQVEIDIPESSTNSSVKLKGNMASTVVTVKQPVEIDIADSVGKLELEADVTLSGNVNTSIEKKSDSVSITPKNEEIKQQLISLKQNAITSALEAIAQLPDTQGYDDLSDVETVGLLVDTAYALGAVRSDFEESSIEKYELAVETLSEMQTLLQKVRETFSQLPVNPENIGGKHLATLVAQYDAAYVANKLARVELSAEQIEDYIGEALYTRFTSTDERIETLKAIKDDSFEQAREALNELVRYTDLTHENIDEAIVALKVAKEKVATAIQNGNTFTNVENISDLETKVREWKQKEEEATQRAKDAVKAFVEAPLTTLAELKNAEILAEEAVEAVSELFDEALKEKLTKQLNEKNTEIQVLKGFFEVKEYTVDLQNLITTLSVSFDDQTYGAIQKLIPDIVTKIEQLTIADQIDEIQSELDRLTRLLHEIEVKAVKEYLVMNEILMEDIILPTEMYDDVVINWKSSDEDVISVNGVVIRPESDRQVTLTASITKGEVMEEKTFAVTVKAKQSEPPILTLNNNSSTLAVGQDIAVSVNKAVVLYLIPEQTTLVSPEELENLKVKSSTVDGTENDALLSTKGLEAGKYQLYAVDDTGLVSKSISIELVSQSLEIFLDSTGMVAGEENSQVTVAVSTENIAADTPVHVMLMDDKGEVVAENHSAVITLGNEIAGNATITLNDLSEIAYGSYVLKVAVGGLETTKPFTVHPTEEEALLIPAEEAVEAYLQAPISTLDEIARAVELKEAAEIAVSKVSDEQVRTDLVSQIAIRASEIIEQESQLKNYDSLLASVDELRSSVQTLAIGYNDVLYNQIYADIDVINEKKADLTDSVKQETIQSEMDGVNSLLTETEVNLVKDMLGFDHEVEKDLIFEEEKLNGVTVSWSSSHTDVVSNDGVVTQPEIGEADQQVTITAMISKGNISETKEFEILVKAKQDEPPMMKLVNNSDKIAVGHEIVVELNEFGTVYLLPMMDAMPSSVEELEEKKQLSMAVNEYKKAGFSSEELELGHYQLYAVDSTGRISEKPIHITVVDKWLYAGFDRSEMFVGEEYDMAVHITVENATAEGIAEVLLFDETGSIVTRNKDVLDVHENKVGDTSISLTGLGTLKAGNYTVKITADGLESTIPFTVKDVPKFQLSGRTTKDTDTDRKGGVENHLRWDDIEEIEVTDYVILRSETDNILDAVEVGKVKPGIGEFIDHQVVPGTTYTYYVKIVTPIGNHTYEVETFETVVDTDAAPDKPTNIQAVFAETVNGVQITWTDSLADDVTGYDIYRVNSKNELWDQASYELVAANVSPGIQLFVDKAAQPDEYYYYFVDAKDQSGFNRSDSMPQVFTGVKEIQVDYNNQGNQIVVTANYSDYVPLDFSVAPASVGGFTGDLDVDFGAVYEQPTLYDLTFDPVGVTADGQAIITIFDNNFTEEDASDDIVATQTLKVNIINGIVEILGVE